jgi:hypothetical protein
MVMRKTAQAPVSGLELFFYSIESGTRNLHLAMRTTSAAAAGAAATAATLAASATDHGFSGLLIMYHTAYDKCYDHKQDDHQ